MNKLVFTTKRDAVKFLYNIPGLAMSINRKFFYPLGTYMLNHGEYAPPNYIPRWYKDGWSIHVSYYYYPGTCYAPKDGRIDPDVFFDKFL
jgi:hypothetical protein